LKRQGAKWLGTIAAASTLQWQGRANEMSLTRNSLSARQAGVWGLVNRVLPTSELLPATRAMARDRISTLPDMLPATKRFTDDGYALPFDEAVALALERERSQAHRAQVTGAAFAQRLSVVLARGKAQSDSRKRIALLVSRKWDCAGTP
jgi:enoyl-CoA hydratase